MIVSISYENVCLSAIYTVRQSTKGRRLVGQLCLLYTPHRNDKTSFVCCSKELLSKISVVLLWLSSFLPHVWWPCVSKKWTQKCTKTNSTSARTRTSPKTRRILKASSSVANQGMLKKKRRSLSWLIERRTSCSHLGSGVSSFCQFV